MCDKDYHMDFYDEHCEVVVNLQAKWMNGYGHGSIYEVKLSTK